MTTTFYAPPASIRASGEVWLPPEEAAHAVRVLRKRPDDEIVVVDGEGGWYRVRLDQVATTRTAGRVLETQRDVGEPAYDLRLGVGLLKHRGRFEFILEKAAELGVREVIPLLTRRTEKATFRRSRAVKVLIAAMKQSGRSRLIRVGEPRPLARVLHDSVADLAFIAHERTAPDHRLADMLARSPSAVAIDVLIGPEGGFDESEVAEAAQAGFTPVSLGPRRLRTETAALVAASAVMMQYG